MKYISDITVVHPKEGDYEMVYAGGRLVIHGYRVNAYDLLNALGFDVELKICTDESLSNRIPDSLGKMDFVIDGG